MSKRRQYEGRSMRVTYDASRCLHAAECVRGLPAVFDPDRRPWVDPDAAGAEAIVAVIRRCPTGALQHELPEEGEPGMEEAGATFTVTVNGPLMARGELDILDADRQLIGTETRAAFCRCGASANKPYCDGSHAKVAFEAPAAIGEGRLKPRTDDTSGRLTVRLRTNGPLLLDGPFVLGADGSTEVAEGAGCALCRCGASSNKPFCDGTHNSIGFEAEDPTGG